jgi:hypothetical protein
VVCPHEPLLKFGVSWVKNVEEHCTTANRANEKLNFNNQVLETKDLSSFLSKIASIYAHKLLEIHIII